MAWKKDELEMRLTIGRDVREALRITAAFIADENLLQEFERLNDDVDKISRDN